jgi:hypothetical protein
MEHKPCGLLSDTYIASDFIAADSVLAIANQPSSGKPLIQPERTILKDSSDLHTELTLRMASLALPYAARRNKAHLVRPASRTGHPVRPASLSQVSQAVIGVGEVDNRVFKIGRFVRHERIIEDLI